MLVLSVFGAEKPIQIINWQTWMRRLDIKAAVVALNSPITNRRSRYKEYQAPWRKAKEEILWEHMRVDGVNNSCSKRGWQRCKYKEKKFTLWELSKVNESSWEFMRVPAGLNESESLNSALVRYNRGTKQSIVKNKNKLKRYLYVWSHSVLLCPGLVCELAL